MKKSELDKIIEEIARAHNSTANQVRKEMQLAMDAGQASEDPIIRQRWDAIPRKGNTLSLEEFVEYLVTVVKNRA